MIKTAWETLDKELNENDDELLQRYLISCCKKNYGNKTSLLKIFNSSFKK